MRTIGIDIRLIGKKRTGDETVFFNLTKYCLKQDTDNRYRLFTDLKEPNELALLQGRLECIGNPRVEFISIPVMNRFGWNFIGLPRAIRRHPVDVYHTQYIAPFFLPRNVSLFTHVHDLSFLAHPEWIHWKDRLFLSALMPRSFKRTTRFLVPSRFTRAELMRFAGVSREKISIIPNAISEEWYSQISAEETQSIKEKYSLPKNYFVSVGTLQPRKNIPFLMEAFENFRMKYPEVSLVLVGNVHGQNVDAWVKKAKEDRASGVIFPGYLSERELRAIVAGGVAFVFPSLYEGFGIPILEAFAVGTAAAVSDIAAFREVAGESVVYFDPASLAEAENALYTLFIDEEKRRHLALAGKKHLEHFSWKQSAERLIVLYSQS